MTDVVEVENAANEAFEIIGVENRSWLKQIVSDLTKASTAKQVTVGGLTGWATSYVLRKYGRWAALTICGSLVVVQVAHHTGYIAIDWGRLEHKVRQTQRKIESEANHALPRLTTENVDVRTKAFYVGLQLSVQRDQILERLIKQYKTNIKEVKEFVQENFFLSGAFAGGFLIGMAT